MRLTRRDRKEASDALDAVLRAVEDGVLTADTPQEKRMLRRMEGAVAALGAEVGLARNLER